MKHKELRNKTNWLVSGELVPISKLTDDHLHSIRMMLKTKGRSVWNGKPTDQWLEIIRDERIYRNQLANTILYLLGTKGVCVLV